MTTDPHDEHGEILRRALRAEADSVNPAGDGLERIRARIAEGQGRRFGLGRFGPARFGWDRFTVNWARPVLAVAAAVAIAGLGVTAPQTINLIQQSVGSNGPSDSGHGDADGDSSDAQGTPEFPDPTSPGSSVSGAPTATSTTHPSSSPGLSSCPIPPSAAGTASASPGTTATPSPTTGPCPSETPTARPTTPAATTEPTTPPATPQPTDQPTQTPTSAPANPGEQGAATTS